MGPTKTTVSVSDYMSLMDRLNRILAFDDKTSQDMSTIKDSIGNISLTSESEGDPTLDNTGYSILSAHGIHCIF